MRYTGKHATATRTAKQGSVVARARFPFTDSSLQLTVTVKIYDSMWLSKSGSPRRSSGDVVLRLLTKANWVVFDAHALSKPSSSVKSAARLVDTISGCPLRRQAAQREKLECVAIESSNRSESQTKKSTDAKRRFSHRESWKVEVERSGYGLDCPWLKNRSL